MALNLKVTGHEDSFIGVVSHGDGEHPQSSQLPVCKPVLTCVCCFVPLFGTCVTHLSHADGDSPDGEELTVHIGPTRKRETPLTRNRCAA